MNDREIVESLFVGKQLSKCECERACLVLRVLIHNLDTMLGSVSVEWKFDASNKKLDTYGWMSNLIVDKIDVGEANARRTK